MIKNILLCIQKGRREIMADRFSTGHQVIWTTPSGQQAKGRIIEPVNEEGAKSKKKKPTTMASHQDKARVVVEDSKTGHHYIQPLDSLREI
ncbi:MAG: hypothetical protein K0S74_74 [Chlamydiales bacterium]|jgi:hypothetical protein|nr:hypothetical protein [Chlamydiales bacterium]